MTFLVLDRTGTKFLVSITHYHYSCNCNFQKSRESIVMSIVMSRVKPEFGNQQGKADINSNQQGTIVLFKRWDGFLRQAKIGPMAPSEESYPEKSDQHHPGKMTVLYVYFAGVAGLFLEKPRWFDSCLTARPEPRAGRKRIDLLTAPGGVHAILGAEP